MPDSAMTLTVFSKPDCVQCDFTKRELDSKSLEYNEIDVTVDEEARKMLQELGITQLPVVRIEHPFNDVEWWSGFRIEKLRAL